MVQKEFRKPPRYMVGDIVYSHGFICIVCSVYPFNIDYSYDLKVIDRQSFGKICQNDIMHVHIWEEFLKKMDGHVIALKENVLGIGGINTKNTLSLCDIIISWEYAEYLSMTEKTILL